MDQLSPSFSIQTLQEIVRNCQLNEQRLHELKRHTRHERKKAERLLHETYRIKQEQLTTQNENSKPKQQPIEFFISLDDDDNNNSYQARRDNKTQRVRFNIPEKLEPKKSNIDDELDNLARRCEHLLSRLTIHQTQAEALPNLENDQSVTLQQALEAYHPNFISHSQQRVQHINDLRGEREHQQIFSSSKPIRVQSAYQDMKQTAKKKYDQLPEVTNRLQQDLINEIKQRNYLRAKLFRTRLRQHVLLHGRTNIDASLTMIDT